MFKKWVVYHCFTHMIPLHPGDSHCIPCCPTSMVSYGEFIRTIDLTGTLSCTVGCWTGRITYFFHGISWCQTARSQSITIGRTFQLYVSTSQEKNTTVSRKKMTRGWGPKPKVLLPMHVFSFQDSLYSPPSAGPTAEFDLYLFRSGGMRSRVPQKARISGCE